jgi:hypothetical protein
MKGLESRNGRGLGRPALGHRVRLVEQAAPGAGEIHRVAGQTEPEEPGLGPSPRCGT